jgi:hypothetical protein
MGSLVVLLHLPSLYLVALVFDHLVSLKKASPDFADVPPTRELIRLRLLLATDWNEFAFQ